MTLNILYDNNAKAFTDAANGKITAGLPAPPASCTTTGQYLQVKGIALGNFAAVLADAANLACVNEAGTANFLCASATVTTPVIGMTSHTSLARSKFYRNNNYLK